MTILTSVRGESAPGLPGSGDRRSAGPSGPPPTIEPTIPPTGIGPTFLAAAAILAGSSALSTPISGASWVFPLVEVVAVIWLVGVGGRLIRVPTLVTVLLQLTGFIVALTSLFTSSGIGGVLPNRAALAEAGALLSGAWDQIAGTAPPAPATPELNFLIALSVGCAALIADFLVAVARSPALVALPLLCLYSVPASIAPVMLPWYSFAIPALLYAVLLAGVGHRDRRTGARAGVGMALNGATITALATVVALLVAGSVTSIGTTGRLPHTNGNGRGTIGLSPLATLRGALQRSTPVDVLTASGVAQPGYFRTVALTKWTVNDGFSLSDLQADVSDISGPLDGSFSATGDSRVTVTTQGYQDRFLPILDGTTSVSGLEDPWDWDAALRTVYRADKVRPGSYLLDVRQGQPDSSELRADTVVPGGPLTETGSLPKQVRDTAMAVTAGADSAFDKADALRKWFTDSRNGFTYSLAVPAGDSGDSLIDFLTNKKGFCEQYAAAMAVMLRSLNIPSRVVVGFTQGIKQPNGSYLVTSHDAHAWVEVKFDQNGWVSFDPTPPVDGQGGQQGFHENAVARPTSSVAATQTRTLATTKAQLPNESTRATRSSVVATAADVAAAAGPSSSGWPRFVLVTLLAVALMIGLLLLPTAVRQGRRRNRLRSTPDRPGTPADAWAEIEDTAIDHGIVPNSAESARATANRIAKRAHLNPDDRARLRGVVMAAEREWYGDSPSMSAQSAFRGAPGAGLVPPDLAEERGTGATASAGALLTRQRPAHEPKGDADLPAAALSVISGLREHAKIRLAGRILPRSLRSSGRS